MGAVFPVQSRPSSQRGAINTLRSPRIKLAQGAQPQHDESVCEHARALRVANIAEKWHVASAPECYT